MLTKLFIVGLLFGLLFTNSFAQVEEAAADATPPKDEAAVKFAEFGDIPKKEAEPILEEFSDILRNGEKVGYFVYYGSFNETPFKQGIYFNNRKKSRYADLLIRGCAEDMRLRFIDGPLLRSMKVELWLAVPGGARPLLQDGHVAPAPGVMPLFISGEPIDLKEALIQKEKKNEPEPEEDFPADSQLEGYDFIRDKRDPADISFNFLKRIKNSSGILIYYLDDSVYVAAKARQILERKMRETDDPVIFSRVRIIFGGYRAEPEVERWEVIRGGIEPEPVPDQKPAQ